MSSFRQTKTNMNNEEHLVKALKSMGYNPEVHKTQSQVRGHGSERRMANVILKMEELKDGGDIGFAMNKEGSYEAVMDTYVLRKTNHQDLLKQINVKYTETAVKAVAQKNGWTQLMNKSVTKNGETVQRLQFTVPA